ncbi:MAG: prohibitin family protein [Candidatus Colwellbacteria bacterium]|nr:prohibitin family protein [Candidatus Colwellbacteria bacterium]
MALVGLFVLIFVTSGLLHVDATERAVVFHANGDLEIKEPGRFQWVTPIFNTVTKYDVRSVAYTVTAEGIALDQQAVFTEVTVLYHPNETKIQTIHQTLGINYEGKVVVPAVQDSVKSAVNFFAVEDLRGENRELVKQDIIRRITADVERQNLVVDKVSLTDFDFTGEYNLAVEKAAIAERDVQKELAVLKQKEIIANQTRVEADGQGYAIERLAAATSGEKGQAYLFLKWLEAWIAGGSQVPTTLVGDETPFAIPVPWSNSGNTT